MVTVPRREEQIGDRPLQVGVLSPNVPEGTFGGGRASNQVFEAGQRLTDFVTDYAIKQRQRADEMAVNEANVRLSRLSNELEVKAKGLRGRQSLEAPDIIEDEWRNGYSSIISDLGNEYQKEQVSLLAQDKRVRLDSVINVHMDSEIRSYDANQTEDGVTLARDRATLNHDDPDTIKSAIAETKDILQAYGKRQGIPKKTIDVQISRAISSLHREVVARKIIDGQLESADNYAKDYSDEILERDQQIFNTIKQEEKRRKALLQDQTEANTYLQYKQNTLSLDELDSLFFSNKISQPFYEAMEKRVLKINDDPRIPDEDKVSVLFELARKFDELNGADVDYSNFKIKKVAGRNRLGDIQNFRKFLADNADHIPDSTEKAFLKATQESLDDAMAGKVSKLREFFNFLGSTFNKTTGIISPIINPLIQKSIEILGNDVNTEEATKKINELKRQAIEINNPVNGNYVVGEVYQFPQGRYKVSRFDENGKPKFVEAQ